MDEDTEDVLGPLVSPGHGPLKPNSALARFSSMDDDSESIYSTDNGAESRMVGASPHIPGTRRLQPKHGTVKANNPGQSLTQHIRHRSSLFWLKSNSIRNIDAYEESDWDAESFITRRKELQFALEKLPVFKPRAAPASSAAAQANADGEEAHTPAPSFDLLAAKLAQEDVEYEQELLGILHRRKLQRAFEAWVAFRAWKMRLKKAKKAASEGERNGKKKLLRGFAAAGGANSRPGSAVQKPPLVLEPEQRVASDAASTTIEAAAAETLEESQVTTDVGGKEEYEESTPATAISAQSVVEPSVSATPSSQTSASSLVLQTNGGGTEERPPRPTLVSRVLSLVEGKSNNLLTRAASALRLPNKRRDSAIE